MTTPKEIALYGLAIAFAVFAIGYAAALVRRMWNGEDL